MVTLLHWFVYISEVYGIAFLKIDVREIKKNCKISQNLMTPDLPIPEYQDSYITVLKTLILYSSEQILIIFLLGFTSRTSFLFMWWQYLVFQFRCQLRVFFHRNWNRHRGRNFRFSVTHKNAPSKCSFLHTDCIDTFLCGKLSRMTCILTILKTLFDREGTTTKFHSSTSRTALVDY